MLTHTSAVSTFCSPVTNLLSILHILMKFLSHGNAKKWTKWLRIYYIFLHFYSSFSNKTMEVKGLTFNVDKCVMHSLTCSVDHHRITPAAVSLWSSSWSPQHRRSHCPCEYQHSVHKAWLTTFTSFLSTSAHWIASHHSCKLQLSELQHHKI